jgi:hypothetical protein
MCVSDCGWCLLDPTYIYVCMYACMHVYVCMYEGFVMQTFGDIDDDVSDVEVCVAAASMHIYVG